MPHTERLIVARAEVTDEVHVDEAAPDTVRLALGTELYVKFPYHFVEASRDKETYTFILDARLGDDAPDPVQTTWHDRPGVKDELQGMIQHRFLLREAGEHELEFRAEARYHKQAWTGDGDEQGATVGVEGTVRILVE